MPVRTILSVSILGLALTAAVRAGDPDPLLWYTFDDPGAGVVTNLGSLGAEYNGILNGNAEMIRSGDGFAVSLDGNGDWVIPDGNQDALDVGDDDFTLYARVTVSFLDPQIVGARGIIWKEETGSQPMYLIAVRNENSLVPFCLADGDEFVCSSSTTELDLDTEYELRAVRSADVLYVFIDGCLEGVALVQETLESTANDNDLIIGGRTVGQGQSGGANDDFAGLIHEVRVYDEAVFPDGFCPGDLNCDGQVNGADLGLLLGAWGGGAQPADLNVDGAIDGADLGLLLGAWGDCPD